MSEQYLAYSYDDPQIEEQILNIPMDKLKICDACGRQFFPSGRNAWRMRYCQRQHYIKCQVCGTVRNISLTKGHIVSTCSKKCGDIFKMQQTQSAVLAKYGVSNVSQVPEIKEKARASNALHKDETMAKIRRTMIERYGAAVPRQVPKLREKIDNTMMERYGVVNPSHSKVIREKISKINSSDEVKAKYKATSLIHFGTEYPAQNPDSPNAWNNIKDKLESTMISKYGVPTPFMSDACKEKAKQTCLINYGYEYASQSPEVHRRQWKTRLGWRGVDGTPLDSSYEVLVYNFWKFLNLDIDRNIPISFNYNGSTHTTLIDFKVNGVLYEVKGGHLLNGVYSYMGVPMSVKLDIYRTNNVIVITDNLEATRGFFNDDHLIGIDIALFDSTSDSFCDAKSRWTRIEYLIKHKKGFISFSDFQ